MKLHHTREIASSFLKRKVKIELIGPPVSDRQGPRGLLLLNDGQLAEVLRVKETLQKLHVAGHIIPVQVVAIHAGERHAEYGVTGTRDYMGRGAKAGLYESFIIRELLPRLNAGSGNHYTPGLTAFAGFSLGGLSAMDIVTSNPAWFSSVGVFSGSLWWRSKSYEDGYTDTDRILFNKIVNTRLTKYFRCYLMAGTNDERNDRNGNGIIDAVDDTLDMFELLASKINIPEKNLLLNIVNGGKHDPATWSKQFPEFLVHTFGTS